MTSCHVAPVESLYCRAGLEIFKNSVCFQSDKLTKILDVSQGGLSRQDVCLVCNRLMLSTAEPKKRINFDTGQRLYKPERVEDDQLFEKAIQQQ